MLKFRAHFSSQATFFPCLSKETGCWSSEPFCAGRPDGECPEHAKVSAKSIQPPSHCLPLGGMGRGWGGEEGLGTNTRFSQHEAAFCRRVVLPAEHESTRRRHYPRAQCRNGLRRRHKDTSQRHQTQRQLQRQPRIATEGPSHEGSFNGNSTCADTPTMTTFGQAKTSGRPRTLPEDSFREGTDTSSVKSDARFTFTLEGLCVEAIFSSLIQPQFRAHQPGR